MLYTIGDTYFILLNELWVIPVDKVCTNVDIWMRFIKDIRSP